MKLTKVAGTKRELDSLIANSWSYLGEHAAIAKLDKKLPVIERLAIRQRLGQPPPPIYGDIAGGSENAHDAASLTPLGLKGVAVVVVESNRTKEILWDESSVNFNVVVKNGRQKIWDAFIAGTIETVTKMRFGTNGTTPNENDTNVNAAATPDIELSSATRVEQTLKAVASVDSNTLNGNTLAEGALLFSDDTILNHYLISPTIAKDVTKTITSTIEVTANSL